MVRDLTISTERRLTRFDVSRACAGILPYPDSKGHDLQTETFKFYWELAHRDPTSGVQVRPFTTIKLPSAPEITVAQ